MCVFFRLIDHIACVQRFGALHISVAPHLSVMTVQSAGQPTSRRRGYTQGLSITSVSCVPRLPPAVLAFILIARTVQPSVSLVYNDVNVCERVISRCTHESVAFYCKVQV